MTLWRQHYIRESFINMGMRFTHHIGMIRISECLRKFGGSGPAIVLLLYPSC